MTPLSGLRCAVLGASGFIGTNLVRALAAEGCSVRLFGRRQRFQLESNNSNWIYGDFADPTVLADVVDDCDVVFHLVNSTTPASSNIDKIADIKTSVVSTLQLLEVCRASRVGRVVFVSSGGTVYGIPQSTPIPETANTDPICAYGVSKLAVEKYLHLYEYLHGLEYRVLRVANPYGPYQTALKNQGVIGAFLACALAGRPIEIWGDGSVVRDFLYVSDVVEALVQAAVHSGPERVFNIAGGQGYSLSSLVTEMEHLLGRELAMVKRPGRVVDVTTNVLDISLARSRLNWSPRVALPDGLGLTLEWMRSHLENA